mgnify:CR=1 FL=1
MNLFSHCILTASDEAQAKAFRALLERRIAHGLYPREISFHVYPDPPGRVGSGGGTLWALHCLYRELGLDPSRLADAPDAPTVLIIHAAGESRRLPVFAPEGKLFAPVPVPSSSVIPPVVLDLQLALYLRFPWQPGQVVVGSGDVIIDFDTDALAGFEAPITGFATPASFKQGSRHGVFRFDSQFRALEDYYQKQPQAFLEEHAAIEGADACALDIGIVAMRAEYISRLFALGAARTESGATLLESVAAGDLQFGLYLEQLSASLGTVSRDEFLRRVAAGSALSSNDQALFYDHLHSSPLGGHLARKCTFLHFGSVAEFPEAAARVRESGLKPFYSALDSEELQPEGAAGALLMNSIETDVTASATATALADATENAVLTARGALLASALPPGFSADVPDGFCLDGRLTPDGAVLAVYHAGDSFRPADLEQLRFCAVRLADWLQERGLTLGDVQPGESAPATATARASEAPATAGAGTRGHSTDLLTLPLFPAGPAAAESVFAAGFWHPPEDPAAWAAQFKAAPRYSLRELNQHSDPAARDARRQEIRTRQLAAQLSAGRGWRTASGHDVAAAVGAGADTEVLKQMLQATADPVLRLYRSATLAHAGVATAVTHDGSNLRFLAEGSWLARRRAVKADQIVWARSPVRLDLAGGWTDTPPYTNVFGGAVTNVAVDLNGQPPIQVFVRPLREPHIIFHSIDLGARERITTVDELRAYTDPSASFALPRAACVLLGLDQTDGDLEAALKPLGGGFELSLLAAIPKGSGLGTSSVLGGVMLAALFRYFGLEAAPDDLFLSVLELEQMLTTGGGWQDQIGGLAGGVKYIESRPGSHPRPLVHQLDPWLFEEPEYRNRMTLYYTGVTRLAKNILQEVVDRVNAREPAFLFTHEQLRSLAGLARSAIALRDYPRLCRIITGSWRGNRLIHQSTSNEEIDALLAHTGANWDAAKLLGAGGGGYALFASASVEAADRLRTQLETLSAGADTARLVDFSLSRAGLAVSVS